MGAVEVNGYTIEPRANLSAANLERADLDGADLHGANLSAITVPSAVTLPVSSMTSQAVASDCIHVPLNDTIWLKKYSR